ncbi:MAG: hypothetical protein ACTSXN_05840 [Promethearchaeota archaeon]
MPNGTLNEPAVILDIFKFPVYTVNTKSWSILLKSITSDEFRLFVEQRIQCL